MINDWTLELYKNISGLPKIKSSQIMIFDSLDLLSKIDGAHELLWFPPTLPSNVKVRIWNQSNTDLDYFGARLKYGIPYGLEGFLSFIPKKILQLFCSITPGASTIAGTMRRLVEEEEQYVEVPSLGMVRRHSFHSGVLLEEYSA